MAKTSRPPRAAARDSCAEPAEHGSPCSCAGSLADEYTEAPVGISDLAGTVGP